MWNPLQALVPYFGGKRRLLGQIFKHLPGPKDARTFVDAFLGGGSVSLFAKARGYRVVCNDSALRSHIVGRALIENDRVALTSVDVTRLFTANGSESHFIEETFAPDVVTTPHAKFLDTAFANAREAQGTKKWLLLLLLVKYVLRMRPMGNFGAKTIIHQAEECRWDEMNQHYLKDILVRGIAGHPKAVAEKLRRQVNKGVFSNGQKNEAYQMDVFEFLEQIEGEVVYLDPPYGGTSAYETALRPLDSMLEGRVLKPEPSVFSQKGALDALERLFAAARRFPTWVISYGNQEVELEALVRLIRRFKTVVSADEFRYTHLTGLSGAEHREKNREFLVVAKGDR